MKFNKASVLDHPLTSTAQESLGWQGAGLNLALRFVIKPRLQNMPATPDAIGAMRAQVETLAAKFQHNDELIEWSNQTMGTVPVEVLQAKDEDSRTDKQILYIHGGAFIFCSPRTHRGITVPLARGTAARIVAADYRLSPEHCFPAAVDDVLNVYRAMLASTPADKIAVVGDSAGGNLTLALLHAARREDLPMPACAVCLSPWTDLSGKSDSVRDNIDRDAFLPGERLTELAQFYLHESYIKEPTASPLYGEFNDFPPLLFHVGDTEILFDDSVRCVGKAREAGVEAHLRIWPKLPHVFHAFSTHLPVARTALNEISDFIVSKWTV